MYHWPISPVRWFHEWHHKWLIMTKINGTEHPFSFQVVAIWWSKHYDKHCTEKILTYCWVLSTEPYYLRRQKMAGKNGKNAMDNCSTMKMVKETIPDCWASSCFLLSQRHHVRMNATNGKIQRNRILFHLGMHLIWVVSFSLPHSECNEHHFYVL